MRKVLLVLTFVLLSQIAKNQVYSDAQLKTAYIYNFALNIEWPNEKELKSFKIGILGTDSALYNNLSLLATTKTLRGIQIVVVKYTEMQEILNDKPQLVYLTYDKSQDIKQIFYEIIQQPILLVTDQATQNIYVMLNFKVSPVTKKITFEMNKKNIEDQKLKILPNLLLLGGTELDQKQLYKLKEDELAKEKEIVKEQQEKLRKQQVIIDSQLTSINKQETIIKRNKKSVDSLMIEIRKQQERLSIQNQNLEKLQVAIRQQQLALANKVNELRIQQDSAERQKILILSQREQIREKLSQLDKLNNEISEKEKSLNEQESRLRGLQDKLKIQQIFMMLMGLIIALVVFIIIIIFRNYRQKKALNDKLVQKNNEVEQQAEELQQINIELVQQRDQIQKQNEYITDSISYAKKILLALLPDLNLLNNDFEHFLVYKPKDIVSGDFYWYAEYEKYRFVAVVDCTGHGVPGALLSILGSRLLTEIVIDKGIFETAHILKMLNFAIQKILKQKAVDLNVDKSNDGMDVCLCRFIRNNERIEIQFSGAKRPLIYINSKTNEINRISGSHTGIGGFSQKLIEFETQEFSVNKNDMIILMSDGFIDQNNPQRKRFGTPQFLSTLEKNLNLEMKEQKVQLENEILKWQANERQRDDITILALKVK